MKSFKEFCSDKVNESTFEDATKAADKLFEFLTKEKFKVKKSSSNGIKVDIDGMIGSIVFDPQTKF